ncbi:signal peptidase I [Maioricimonas rarisocia]|nr:signal peptidase I [Maioricimonas rarisocia]
MFESLLVLAVAVVVFRGFIAEGYLISTGSMAPCLLGYHRRVDCPSCGYQFARGVSKATSGRVGYATSGDPEPGQELGGTETGPVSAAICPNCGLDEIETAALPTTEGDQLLVHKNAFQFREPRRWEVAVFRNPGDPRQAYVKRIVGLPGETIELIDGDVYAGGLLQRKPLATQLGMRILVDDHAHRPAEADPDWQPRWLVPETGGWTEHRNRFDFRPGERSDHTAEESNELAWVQYRHWLRSGGTHRTSVRLNRWPDDATSPDAIFTPLSYRDGRLHYVGAMPARERDRWLDRSADPRFHEAVRQLYERSHTTWVPDVYGYNHPLDVPQFYPLRDLMFEASLERHGGTGEFRVEMTDGRHEFTTVIDFDRREARLHVAGVEGPVRTGRWPPREAPGPVLLQMSTMDRQILVAIDGAVVFEPVAYAEGETPPDLPRYPVRFAARGVDLTVSGVQVFRDVYYTPRNRLNEQTTFELHEDEFFVLGDNSPVSIDSRSWDHPAVHRSMLIGKPFLVHLPSRPGRLWWGGEDRYFRVPDLARIRYIR